MGLIGMAGLIKFLPLLHWATVVARRRSADAWIGMVLTFAFGLGILVAAVGWNDAVDGIGKQAELLRGRHSPRGIIERGADLRPNNESIPMVLVRLYGGSLQVADAVASTRLPLQTILAIWYGSVAALAGAWLFALVPAARVPPERGWLAMFALTSIVMLVSTPICWNHYFLWTMPAALFLLYRPKLLIMLALLSLGITTLPAAQFAGMPHDDGDRSLRRGHSRPVARTNKFRCADSPRELICEARSHYKLVAELVEAGPTAKKYDAVAGFERLVAAGGELDTTVGSLDGHHHDAGAAADVGVAECLAGQWAIDADRDVIHLDGQAGSLGDQLDEFHGRRVGEQRDDAVGADDGRHDHVVGPGLPELFLGGGLLGPGDDQEIGESSAQ